MEKKTYELNFLSKAGPYSHVVEAGDFLYLSGMVPVDAEHNLRITDDVGKGAELILNNMQRALRCAGSDMGRVVKVTVFLTDMAAFDAMNAVYKTFFLKNPPARSCVAVKDLPGGFPIEIEAVALR